MYAVAVVATVPESIVVRWNPQGNGMATVATEFHIYFLVQRIIILMSHLNPIPLSFDGLDAIDEEKGTSGSSRNSAAVLIAITDQPDNPELIFTRRADHLNSHRGQVSFPGGRWEPGDDSLVQTALRESREEIALDADLVAIVGCMSPRISVNDLDVYPYVGVVSNSLSLSANPDEIASIFKVPMNFFKEVKPARLDCLSRHGKDYLVPAWDFEGFDIWGLTAMFTCDLMGRLNIALDFSGVPERRYG